MKNKHKLNQNKHNFNSIIQRANIFYIISEIHHVCEQGRRDTLSDVKYASGDGGCQYVNMSSMSGTHRRSEV